MATPTINPLADALGSPLPKGLEALSKAELQVLATAFASATQQQRIALAAATEAALSHVPLLLRGAVRKVLFG